MQEQATHTAKDSAGGVVIVEAMLTLRGLLSTFRLWLATWDSAGGRKPCVVKGLSSRSWPVNAGDVEAEKEQQCSC